MEAHARQERDIAAAIGSFRRRIANRSANGFDGSMDVLALSAGGQAGAFGSGIIRGWGDAGTRPEFDLVTGCSTGAIIAVFAFLGAEGDAVLRELYTTHDTGDVYRRRFWIEIPTSNSYADSTPLKTFIAHYVTDAVVERIGAENRRDRVLLIATSDLDLNELRVWNLTALAADESIPLSQRASRFRDILLASLSIPTLVQPVFIDGDMHADAGLARQLFLSDMTHARAFVRSLSEDGAPLHVWALVNRRMTAPAQMTRNHILPITARSLQMLMDSGLAKDLEDLRDLTRECGGDFAMVAVPEDPSRAEPEDFFDREYMKYLHELGFRMAHDATCWTRAAGGS